MNPGTAVFNLQAQSSTNTYIQKLDSNGNFVWAKSIYVSTFCQGNALATYKSVGNTDMFIVKYNSAGRFNWAKALGGFSANQSNAISLDPSGDTLTTGNFAGKVDFDPSIQAKGFGKGEKRKK